MGDIFSVILLKITHSIDHPFRFGFSLNKEFSLPDFSFNSIFFCFFMFLSSTCYKIWLLIGFYISHSDGITVSIKQKNHIKSLIISMFYQIWNLRHSKHLRITKLYKY